MDYVAHTPPKDKPELPAHRYSDHIQEMLAYGLALFDYVLTYAKLDDVKPEDLRSTFEAALMLHDMGKLDESIQRIFRGEDSGRLPVDHIEAGVAVADNMKNELLAWLIRGHHSPGLSSRNTEKFFIRQLRKKFQLDLSDYCLRGWRHKRDKGKAGSEDWEEHKKRIELTDSRIDLYKQRQIAACGKWPELSMPLPSNNLTVRLMLSCLVDADHGSAAYYSKNTPMPEFAPAQTRWPDRLHALNSYITGIASSGSNPQSERNQLRGEFYRRCFEGELFDSRLVACSAPVGLGKTTSVMAYLLRCAIRDNFSRIFVIAPFSNIIDQTVKVFRQALVLDGEDPESVVAAHHHKADFSNKDMRQYAATWQAPIVVTTAVQFFETLAACDPTKLRKLHNVVGAGIFVDESHACLPAELLDISWHWISQLADSWGSSFVFSSGSMVKFWQDEHLINQDLRELPELLPNKLRVTTQSAEKQRVAYAKCNAPFKRDELTEWLQSEEVWQEHINYNNPSCLVILNTVQSAAVVAYALARQLNDEKKPLSEKTVLHLSTALSPKDRAVMLDEVIRRQSNSAWKETPWYLIATSCVEAGVDLDFAIGFRERCSVTSFLQISGRINRHAKRPCGKLFDFTIQPEDGLNKHPGFEDSSDIFSRMWSDLLDRTDDLSVLCSKALRNEMLLKRNRNKENEDRIITMEYKQGFQEVQDRYQVIESNTATVIVDKTLVDLLEMGVPVGWQKIQENSVQLWINRINKLNLKVIRGCKQDNIYSWIDTYEYDHKLLGIMGGLLKPDKVLKDYGGVIA